MQRTGTHDGMRTALARPAGFPRTDAALLGTGLPDYVSGLSAILSDPTYGRVRLINLDRSGGSPVLTIEVTPFRTWINAFVVCPSQLIQVGYADEQGSGAAIGGVRTESGLGIDCTTLEKIVLPSDFDATRPVRFVVFDGTLSVEERMQADPLMISEPVVLANEGIYEEPEQSFTDALTAQGDTLSATAQIVKWGAIAAGTAAVVYFTYPLLSDIRESL